MTLPTSTNDAATGGLAYSCQNMVKILIWTINNRGDKELFDFGYSQKKVVTILNKLTQDANATIDTSRLTPAEKKILQNILNDEYVANKLRVYLARYAERFATTGVIEGKLSSIGALHNPIPQTLSLEPLRIALGEGKEAKILPFEVQPTPPELQIVQEVLRIQRDGELLPDGRSLWVVCDDLKIDPSFFRYGVNAAGDATATFVEPDLTCRIAYLRTDGMKKGNFQNGKNDYEFRDTDFLFADGLEKKPYVYQNTIDTKKIAWKKQMHTDCYATGCRRQTEAELDAIFESIGKKLGIAYHATFLCDKQIIKAYMYLRGSLGSERLNTDARSQKNGDRYGQINGNKISDRWMLDCYSSNQLLVVIRPLSRSGIGGSIPLMYSPPSLMCSPPWELQITQNAAALRAQRPDEVLPNGNDFWDACDDLKNDPSFFRYGVNAAGDATATFVEPNLICRVAYLRTDGMKEGEYNEYKSYTDKELMPTTATTGSKDCIYKKTIDAMNPAWKQQMDTDCYVKGCRRQTKAELDAILHSLAKKLGITYDVTSTSNQQVVKAYMYLRGSLGSERLNTDAKSQKNGDRYGQIDNDWRIWDRCVLYCHFNTQRLNRDAGGHDSCSIPLMCSPPRELQTTQNASALRAQRPREKLPDGNSFWDACDTLKKDPTFFRYGVNAVGDATATFVEPNLTCRIAYLCTDGMKEGEYENGENEYKSYTDKQLMSTTTSTGNKSGIYKNTIDTMKPAWKKQMDDDCYARGCRRQTKAELDEILHSLAKRLGITYDATSISNQQVIKAYMYLKGSLGSERLNTDCDSQKNGDRYGQIDGNNIRVRWFLYCRSDNQSMFRFDYDDRDCSVSLMC